MRCFSGRTNLGLGKPRFAGAARFDLIVQILKEAIDERDLESPGVCLLDYDHDGWLDIYPLADSNYDALAG